MKKIHEVVNKDIGTVMVEEFTNAVGRPPASQAEMDDFAHYWFDAMSAQLDFAMVAQAAADCCESAGCFNKDVDE